MKKGFTLIELLAVIVILAIIALIATPIVLNIINDARQSSTLRSAEFYLDAVEYTIADAVLHNDGITDKTYHIDKNGNLCKVNLNDDKECPSTEDTLLVEVNGEKPSSGTITIENGNITDISIGLNNKTVIFNSEGKLDYWPASTGPCELQDGYTANTIGAKYECDFGDGKRNFYILELGSNPVTGSTLEADEVALILEGNYDTSTQSWCKSGDNNSCNADGLTSKLDETREAWKSELDAEQVVLPSALQIIVANDPTKNTIEFTYLNQSWLCSWDNPAWASSVMGYWTSSPDAYYSGAWAVSSSGVNTAPVNLGDIIGVRPVVKIKL